jgi:ClpP class serine protease
MFFRKYVRRININKIEEGSTAKILENKLNKIKPSNTHAMFLNINPSSYSKVPASIELSNLITDFRKDKKIPVYTFSEEKVFGPNLLILMSGDKVYTDPNTMFGLFNLSRFKTNYSRLLHDKDVRIKLITSGRYKARLNPFEEWKDEDIKWAQNLLEKEKECFLEAVRTLRGDKLRTDALQKLDNNIFFGNQAKELGLIDGCESIESVLFKEFPSKKIKDVKYKPSVNDYINMFKSSANVSDGYAISDNFDIDQISADLEAMHLDSVCQNSLKNTLL